MNKTDQGTVKAFYDGLLKILTKTRSRFGKMHAKYETAEFLQMLIVEDMGRIANPVETWE